MGEDIVLRIQKIIGLERTFLKTLYSKALKL